MMATAPCAFEYLLPRREVFLEADLPSLSFDLLISAYNSTSRVQNVFQAVTATDKHWLVHREYGFDPVDYPAGAVFAPDVADEAEFWLSYFTACTVPVAEWRHLSVGVDATGFMRPHLLVLLAVAKAAGVRSIDFLYTDPIGYVRAENTQFSKGAVREVRQVRGFEGVHRADAGEHDLLIIGAGYDDELMSRVAENKAAARKLQLFGLPSLEPHMYQESRFRASRAEESVGVHSTRSMLFAPANNPFVTAGVLSARVTRERSPNGKGVQNLYLSPLGTKPQVLGFGIYYLHELAGSAASVTFPFSESYSQETAFGVARVWRYTVEL